MTAFVINGGATTNWDTLTAGSVNATLDTYTISNNTTLLIDTDTYQCANHSTAFGSVDTVSYTGVGGKLKIDPTPVRVIAYASGTGNVPAIGTTITQGGVSAYFLGVWSGWQAEPTASGAAMPASGFIKVKNKTGGNFSASALTGIGATASSADVPGWIEIRGADTATITVPRIGRFEVIQQWFELGTTNGARAQVIPCPTTATIAGVFPAVWIETAAASGVYERYAGAGSIVALATIPTDERGKIVWQTTAGIRIGSDGTNNVGFLPPTGCKVRIPAAIFTTCTRTAGGSGIRVLPNTTLATRQEFVTTSSGDIDINGAVMQWYCNFVQPFSAKVKNSAINDTLVIQESSAVLDIDNVVVAATQAQLNTATNFTSNFAGGTISNSLFTRFSLAASGAYVNTFNFNKSVAISSVKSQTLLNRGNATTGVWTCSQNSNTSFSSCINIGGKSLHATDQSTTFTNLRYADNFSGTTTATNPHYTVEVTLGSVGIMLNGVDFIGLTDVHPYNGLFSAVNSYTSSIRNIGTYASPLSLGSANQSGVVFNTGGNCDGVKAQRIYVANTRTGAWATVNSDNNILVETLKADYADTTVIVSLNTLLKGVSLTGATTGQTAVYGTHWKDSFTSATVGKIEILCNEPTVSSSAQSTITAGTPKYNSVGQVALTVIGDQVTWEMPYFAKGYTALANLAPTLTGTTTGNLTYEFQYDKGAGYNGTWLTLNAANLTGAGAITPATGVKLKVRATCATANAGNLLTNIAIPAVTTSVDQNQTYPLDPITLTVAAQVSLVGAEIRVYDLDNLPAGSLGTELGGVESSASATLSIQTDAGNSVWVQIMKTGYTEFGQQVTLGSTSSTFTALLVADNNT